MVRIHLLLLVSCFACFSSYSQAIDNSPAYKDLHSDRYLRINYENDFFSGTDKYYTQGIVLEVAHPALASFPLAKALIHFPGFEVRYSLAAEHNGYTPSDIATPFLLRGDRPFTACLFAQTSRISADSQHGRRYLAALSTGVIGQAAGGMEMQTAIHRWLHDITPHGWPNQIHNDIILNYEVAMEQRLLQYRNIALVTGSASARAGTLSDRAALGVTLMAGRMATAFGAWGNSQGIGIYAYETAQVNCTLYDATLEGGLFNHSSPYTIPYSGINAFTLQNRFGIVVNYHRISLEYFQSYLSSEFRTGNFHVWGGVQFATTL